jgi:hypothetical protein
MERTYNKKEVEEMCKRSYMRGMSIQYSITSKKMKAPKVFSTWVKELINECPISKYNNHV